MGLNERKVKPSLRKSLVDSHVAATAIAILFFCSLYSVSKALLAMLYPACSAVLFLITAVAIRDIPSSHTLDPVAQMKLLTAFFSTLSALADMAAAWLLARWIYGTGPLRTLGNYRGKLTRNPNA